MRQRYRIVEAPGQPGRWTVAITAYSYRLEDADGREILAYHWHPGGLSPVGGPHLHLGQGVIARADGPGAESARRVGLRPDLATAHLVARRVAFANVVRMLIEEFGVPPRHGRWRAILAAVGGLPDG